MKSSTVLTSIWMSSPFLVFPLLHLYANIEGHSLAPILPFFFNAFYLGFSVTWMVFIQYVFELPIQAKYKWDFKKQRHIKFRKSIRLIKRTIDFIQISSFIFTIIYILLGSYIVLLNDLCFFIFWCLIILDSFKLHYSFEEILDKDSKNFIPKHQQENK